MDYHVSIGDREYRVNVQDNNVLVNGRPVQGKLIPLNGSGLHLLRSGARGTELHLREQDPGTVEVLIGAQRVVAKVETPSRRARHQPDAAQAGALLAPMPGLLLRVLVQPGQPVERGQALVVLESMKMQMQLRSPLSGTVKEIGAQPGAQVEKGALLVVVEES